MAVRDLRARFVLELGDRLSPGLGAIRRGLQGIRDVASRLSGTGMLDGVQRRLEGIRGLSQRLAGVGLLGGALTFAGPLQQAAAFEDTLRQSAMTQGMVGEAATRNVAIVSREYEQLARVTGQRSQAIAQAASDLVAANLPRDVIQQLMPMMARNATATGTSLEDLGRLAISLNQNLKIGPEGMARAFAAMTQAGMEGRFEMREMAAEFPRLTAQAEGLGLTGQRAVVSLSAMLQVARRGAASGSEAANNLGNFLSKITSPETVRNFRKADVDLPRVIADAQRRNINPVEAVIEQIRKMTGGNMFKIGELFGDMQVLNFLRPMLQGLGEYQRVLRAASDANQSLLDQGFETRWAGFHIQMERAGEGATQFARRLGVAVMPKVRALNNAFDWLHGQVERMDEAYPGAIDGLLGWGAAGLGLAGALGSVGVVLPFILTGARMLFAPLLMVGRLVGRLAGVGTAAGLGIAALAAVLVLAAVHIIRNWDRFRGFFQAMWDGVKLTFRGFVTWVVGFFTGDSARATQGVMMMWEGIKGYFGGLWGIVKTLFLDFLAWVDGWTGGAVSAAIAKLSAIWDRCVPAFADTWRQMRAALYEFTGQVDAWTNGQVETAIATLREKWDGLRSWFRGIWDGLVDEARGFVTRVDEWTNTQVAELIARIKAPWDALKGWFSDLWKGIGDAFAAIMAPIEAAIARLEAARARRDQTNQEAEEGRPDRRNGNPGAAMRRGQGWGRIQQPEGMTRPQQQSWSGEITVRAAPGTEVVRTEARTPDVRITAPNRGAMLGAA